MCAVVKTVTEMYFVAMSSQESFKMCTHFQAQGNDKSYCVNLLEWDYWIFYGRIRIKLFLLFCKFLHCKVALDDFRFDLCYTNNLN